MEIFLTKREPDELDVCLGAMYDVVAKYIKEPNALYEVPITTQASEELVEAVINNIHAFVKVYKNGKIRPGSSTNIQNS